MSTSDAVFAGTTRILKAFPYLYKRGTLAPMAQVTS